jgi:PKD repeat protein
MTGLRSIAGWRIGFFAFVSVVTLAGFLPAETFTDDFERPDGPVGGWTAFSGTWSIASGQMTMVPNATAEANIWLGSPAFKVDGDLEIAADVSFGPRPGDAVGRHGGFMFFASQAASRGTAGQNGYEVDWIDRVDPAYNDYGFRVLRFDSGVGATLFSNTTDILDVPLHWKIEVEGDLIRLIADDVTVAEVSDATYRNGFVGAWVYQNNSQLYVDNFQLTGTAVPTSCFAPSTTMGAAPLSVEFDASCATSAQGVAAYDWDFGDGGSGSGAQVSHTFQFGGSYMVTLTVRDPDGDSDTATATILVFDSSPTFSDDFNRADGPIDKWTVYSGSWDILSEQLTTMSSGAENWAWAGDPPYSFPANFTLTFTMSFAIRPADDVGRHGGVMFCATEPTQRGSATIDGYTIDWIDRTSDHGIRLLKITNAAQSVLDIGARDPALYPDPPLDWEIQVEGETIKVTGDGELLLEAKDSTYRRGLFGVWCYSNSQQIVFDDMNVTSPALNPCIGVSPAATVELGTEMTFDGSCSSTTGTPIQTYAWDFGDGATGQGQVVTHTYATAGVWTAKLTITTQLGLSASVERTVETFVPVDSFADDFERPDGSPSGWIPVSDYWTLIDGTLQATVPDAGVETAIYAGDPALRFRGFTSIEFDMEFLSDRPADTTAVGRHAGVFFFAESVSARSGNQNDGYGVDWIDRADATFNDYGYRIYRFDNGAHAATFLNGTPGEPGPGSHWRVELDGDTIRLIVDGELKGEAVDSTYHMGHFAFWSHGGNPTTGWVQQVRFDNLVIGKGGVQKPQFHRGDPNNDGTINITDGIYILNFLFLGGPEPTCREAANPNDDASINITDGIYVLNFLFLGGPPPAAPGPHSLPCGPDPVGSPTDLGCATYTKC